MDDFITTRHRTTCFNCGEDVDQVITAVPNGAQVVCDNCRATRSYIPIVEEVSKKGEYIKPGCYDIWNLTANALCRQCKVTGPHDVTIGCRNFTVQCRECGFTHLYRFNLEYIDESWGSSG